MFVIPTRFVDKNFIVPLVRSIREHGHNDWIAVIDSDSPDKSYIKELNFPNVVVHAQGNKNYVDGAVWFAFENYPNEEFFYILHDSMLVHRNLDEYKQHAFVSFMWFPGSWHDGNEQTLYIQQSMARLGLHYTTDHNSLFGITFFCNRHILQSLKALGLNTVLPSNKLEMMASERIWGFCLKHIGIDVSVTSVKGHYRMPDTPVILEKFILNRA